MSTTQGRAVRPARRPSASVGQGASSPLGASVGPGGVNFSIFSKTATQMELLLFDREDTPRPTQIIPLDLERHRTYHHWHVFVPPGSTGTVSSWTGPIGPTTRTRSPSASPASAGASGCTEC
jgi:glycogen operon protein